MRIKFLGTSAAEGVPAVFCNCELCRHAKEAGGRNIRTRSQILINDDTLFDFPMDTYAHMLSYKLDLSRIKRVLITHAHMDHCYPQEFCMRGEPFARGMTENNVTVYGNPTVTAMFRADVAREIRPNVEQGITVKTVHPFDRISDGDMTIIAVPAKHTKGEECLAYYVNDGTAGALFLNDTGVLDAEVYARLKSMGARVDIVAADSTYGAARMGAGRRHMGVLDGLDQFSIMREVGLLSDAAQLFATHFSHNNDRDYYGMCEFAAPLGVTVAYDGLETEISGNYEFGIKN